MNRLTEMFEAVFAAVAFAECGEWDEAVRIADGSLRQEQFDERRTEKTTAKRPARRAPRPRL